MVFTKGTADTDVISMTDTQTSFRSQTLDCFRGQKFEEKKSAEYTT